MNRNARDADFAQQIIRMRQREQDGEEPTDDINIEESKVDGPSEAKAESPRNFMTRLYEDQNFVKEKELIEEQIMQATTATMESKSFINEMDDFLKDLQSWKSKRADFLEE